MNKRKRYYLGMNIKPNYGVCQEGVDDMNIKHRYGINNDCLIYITYYDDDDDFNLFATEIVLK